MELTARYLRLSVVVAIGSLVLLALALTARSPETARAAEINCPKFRVMHNDKIGKVSFPAGSYSVTLLNGNRLTCAKSTKLFAEFLQDWDGKLRKPWVLNGKTMTFSAGKHSDLGFRVKKAGSSGGGGSGTKMSCPGYFRVLHNDSIGSFKVPRGKYRITLLNRKKMNCSQASRRFQEFLLDFDGILPKPWYLNKRSGTFTRGKSGKVGFNINQAYGPSPNPDKNGSYARCPATFRVLHNDRIGQLKLPKGSYYIYVGRKTKMSCSAASDWFRKFLNRPDGKLPRPWKLNADKARFRAGPGGYVFRVQKA